MGSSDIVRIGKASIFGSYPDWLPVKVRSNYNGAAGPANPIAGRPVPTNKWFSPIFWWTNDLDYDKGTRIALRPMPAMLQVSPWGLMLTYRPNPEVRCGGDAGESCGWPASGKQSGCSNWTNWRFDPGPNTIFAAMVISVEKLLVDKQTTPFFVKASDYGDWDVTLQWDDGQRRLELTALAGGPMLYGAASGGELEFQLPSGDNDRRITFYDSHGKNLGEAFQGATAGPDLTPATDGVLGMSFKTIEGDTVYYAIFAPRGTTWSFTQGKIEPSKDANLVGSLSKLRSSNLASGNQSVPFSVAVLPPPPAGTPFPLKALEAFAAAAGLHVRQTAFSWDPWDTTKGTITAHYTFEARAKQWPANPSVITTLFKPHQTLMDGVDYVLDEAGKPYAYNSPRGPLKLARFPVDTATGRARYSVTYPYYGYVPALPDLSLASGELTALLEYLTADSCQIPAATADFLTDQQPDAYSSGAKLYYKVMQMVFWLQQSKQIERIPGFRGLKGDVDKQKAIETLVSFLKGDLETFFSANRPASLAYHWHFIEKGAGGFTSVDANPPMPQIFPCTDVGNDDGSCNPGGDPLIQSGICWKLTQSDLIKAQTAGQNPYLVLRDLDFTVNAFANTGPATNKLLHFAWKQGERTQTQNINMFAFFAPSSKAASPDKPGEWKQCVWTCGTPDDVPTGAIGLVRRSSFGIGAVMLRQKTDTPWRVGNIPYTGTNECHPNPIGAGKYDVLLVFDCGADCTNFPSMCDHGNKPNVSAPVWNNWELTIGPVHFEGKPYKFIAYNPVWNSLLGNVSWYGSIENLADHHFGWGYLIKAAALVAQFDTSIDPDTGKPWWDIQKGWGGIVNLMIRDVMDWRKPGENDPGRFTFVRSKYLNPVEGHMYANGHGNTGDGNDEESSSEAINFANACIEWGAATGQNEIRDVGILLRSMYAQAVPMYWFNVGGDVLPSTTADKPFPNAGVIAGSGNKHDTYFSGGPNDRGCSSRNSDVVAIETLPVTACTLRMTLFAPQLKVAWETLTNAGGPYCGASAKCYLSTLLCFQALFDAASAKAAFLERASPDKPFTSWYNYFTDGKGNTGLKQPEDHSYAATYAFILSMERLGGAKAQVLPSPDANPFYMPMADGAVLIYNPTRADRTFRIGSLSVTVPGLRCVRVAPPGNP